MSFVAARLSCSAAGSWNDSVVDCLPRVVGFGQKLGPKRRENEMNRTLASVLSVFLLLAGGAVFAADDATDAPQTPPDQVIYDSHAAFAFHKSLVGSWEGAGTKEHDHGGAARKVEIKTTGAGSAVMQTLYPGDKYEMV